MIVMMSSRPNKQRSSAFNARLDKRRDAVSAHLSKELRKQYKRRSMAVRKGDEVKILGGEHAGKTGEVTEVNTKNYTIFVNGVTVKRTIGTDKQRAVVPSNVVITSLNLDDNMRQRILLRKVKEVKVEKREPKPVETKAETKTEAKAEPKQEAKPEVKSVENKKVSEGKKNENEKSERAEVLANGKKVDKVGSRAKAGAAQKA